MILAVRFALVVHSAIVVRGLRSVSSLWGECCIRNGLWVKSLQSRKVLIELPVGRQNLSCSALGRTGERGFFLGTRMGRMLEDG